MIFLGGILCLGYEGVWDVWMCVWDGGEIDEGL